MKQNYPTSFRAAHFQDEKDERIKRFGWVSCKYLCEMYFNDAEEIKTEIVHGYIGTKLRGNLKKTLKKDFGTIREIL